MRCGVCLTEFSPLRRTRGQSAWPYEKASRGLVDTPRYPRFRMDPWVSVEISVLANNETS